MAAQSALARLGLRLATMGSAASLAIAAPIAEGDMTMAAHTDASRVGVYFDRSTPANPFMGVVAGGVEGLRVSKTKVDVFIPLLTAASVAGGAGFNIAPGVAPTVPNNGDVWLTATDLFVRIGGVTQVMAETYVASVNSEATIQAAVAAAEASNYKDAVITITANLNITGTLGSTLTKNYTFIGTGSTGAGGGIRPIITKGNGPWFGVTGKNLTFINLQINSNLPQNFITVGANVNVHFFGCAITHASGNFFAREYAGALTAKFENCNIAVTSGAFLWYGETNPADTNIPQGEVLFTGCTLSGLMVKCDSAGKVNCTLVGSTLTDPGTGCWYATEFSAGRSALVVNYNSQHNVSLATAAGSTDTITFSDTAYLATDRIAYGVANKPATSAGLKYNGNTLTVSRTTAGDTSINLEAGTGPTTARAILFLRGNVGDSTTGWFFIRNGTTIGSHLDLVYTPSANINDGANKHAMRVHTVGTVKIGGDPTTVNLGYRLQVGALTSGGDGVVCIGGNGNFRGDVQAYGNHGANEATLYLNPQGGMVHVGNAALPTAGYPAGTVLHGMLLSTGTTRFLVDSFGVGAFSAYDGRSARGTSVAPTATQSGDEITRFAAWGYGATDFSADARGIVSMKAAENWTDAAQGTYVSFFTTKSGGVATSEKMRLHDDGGLSLGTSYGPSPGQAIIKAFGGILQLVHTSSSPTSYFTCLQATGQADSTSLADNIYGAQIDCSDDSNKATTVIGAISGIAYHFPSPTVVGGKIVTSMYGISGSVHCGLAGGTVGASVAYAYGVKSMITVSNNEAADSVVGDAYGFHAYGQVSRSGAGATTVVNYYGIYLEAPTTGGGGTITNRWGIYSADALATNYFAGLVHLNAAENHAITRVSGNTTLNGTHCTVEVDASGGPVTITLPDSTDAGVNGRLYNVVKVDNTVNAVNIVRSGADLISGATSIALTVQWQSRTMQARAATPGYSII